MFWLGLCSLRIFLFNGATYLQKLTVAAIGSLVVRADTGTRLQGRSSIEF